MISWGYGSSASALQTSIGPGGATVESVVADPLLFKTPPRNVRLLWILAGFVGLEVLVRVVG